MVLCLVCVVGMMDVVFSLVCKVCFCLVGVVVVVYFVRVVVDMRYVMSVVCIILFLVECLV